jgi:hypothetical protein
MFTEMMMSAGWGGTVKVGSTSIAAAGSRTIDCGFAPDKVVLYLNNTSTDSQMTLVYDKSVIGSSYQLQGYRQGSTTSGFNKIALPNTANNAISSVSGNNVTFKVNSNFIGTWYYIAYKA